MPGDSEGRRGGSGSRNMKSSKWIENKGDNLAKNDRECGRSRRGEYC